MSSGVRQRSHAGASAPLVLVVDDGQDTREMYAAYFAYAGFRVETASDGLDAVALVAETSPDVVVMDLSMPRLDGWEATRRIKADPRTKHTLVVVITAHATPADLDRAKQVGADEVRTKPFLPKDLVDVVRDLLQS